MTTEPDKPERDDAEADASRDPAGRRSGHGSAELWHHIQRDDDSKNQDDVGREVIGRGQPPHRTKDE